MEDQLGGAPKCQRVKGSAQASPVKEPHFEILVRPPWIASLGLNDLTRILNRLEDGDRMATEELLPLVYTELRQTLASETKSDPIDILDTATGRS